MTGVSGAGKSTLVNQLYGEEWQWTSEVNDVTGKGRHTTTSRELVPLPKGGMLIDKDYQGVQCDFCHRLVDPVYVDSSGCNVSCYE